MKERILEISKKLGLSHLGSCVSMIEILEAIYETKKPNEKVVLSNGHAGLALYCALEKYEGKNAEELFHKHGVHPHRDEENGIYCSTGSLGQGLPIAVGMALADRNKRVFCTISDGEMMEGSIYEALRIMGEQRLTNLRVIVNANGWGAYRQIDANKFFDYFRSLGLRPFSVIDNKNGLVNVLPVLLAEKELREPQIYIAHTNSDINNEIKGLDSHYKTL